MWLTRITRIDVDLTKEEIAHVGLSVHAQYIVQEVEVHGWLLSGIEEPVRPRFKATLFNNYETRGRFFWRLTKLY